MDKKDALSLNLSNDDKASETVETSEKTESSENTEQAVDNASSAPQTNNKSTSMPDINIGEHIQPASEQDNKQANKQGHGNISSPKNQDDLLTVTLLKELVRLLQPRPFRKRHPIIFWGFFILLGVIIFNLFFSQENPITESERIAVVRIEGAIGEVEPTLKWINRLHKNDSVKGVLLRINSPGGGVGASQEIYSALVELGKKKPVVASMGATAASGGLMVAMAAQHIVANPSTITGSIGVRMDIPQIYELLKAIGVSQETLVTGKYKDATSMMRELTPENRKYLQGILQNLFDQFVDMIAKSRKMTLGEVQKLADGRIFTGLEAQKLGLVDSLGGQNSALAKLYELTGVLEETPLYERPKEMEELYEDFFNTTLRSLLNALDAVNSRDSGHEFLYQ